MVKSIRRDLALDKDVNDFLWRVGQLDKPLTYATKYEVVRSSTGHHTVTVTFIADDEFSRVAEEVNIDG